MVGFFWLVRIVSKEVSLSSRKKNVTDRLTESHAVAFLQADANSAQLAVVHGAAEMAIDVFLGPRADHQSVSADAVLNYLQHPSAPPAAHLTAKGCGDVKAMVCRA